MSETLEQTYDKTLNKEKTKIDISSKHCTSCGLVSADYTGQAAFDR
jgi:hypothetical protein